MAKWIENETEYRYVYLDISAFSSGTVFVKEEAKGVFAIRGRVKNEESNRIQALRFTKDEFSLEQAKAWLEKNKEKVEKSATPIQAIEKNGLRIQQIHFDKSKYTIDKAREFLATKNLDVGNLAEKDGFFVALVKSVEKFRPDTIRNINFREGIKMTVGLMKQAVQKNYSKLDLQSHDINELYDMDITEITLTGSPAIGKAGCIQIMKSAQAKPEHDFVWDCPIAKVDKVKKQIFGYVQVPFVPDIQRDFSTAEEIEKACHGYMRNLAFGRQQGTGTGYEHQSFDPNIAYPIESMIDRQGVYGIKDGWWVGKQITKEDVWKAIENDEITGFSIGGNGKRRKANITPETFQKSQLTDVPKVAAEQQQQAKQEVVVKQENRMSEHDTAVTQNNEMTLASLVMKYDTKPSELLKLEQSGIDVKKAFDAIEQLQKAVGINIKKDPMVGHQVIQIINAVRQSEYGSFGTNAFAVGKSQGQQPVHKNMSLQDEYQMLLNREQELQSEYAQVEKALSLYEQAGDPEGVRKSQMDHGVYPDEQFQQPLEEVEFDINPMEFGASDAQSVIDVMKSGGHVI